MIGAEIKQKRLDRCIEYAKSKGGRCLSVNYVSAAEELLWQCKDGHKWWAEPGVTMKKGAWCPHCRQKITLPLLNEIAGKRGGKCLSDELNDVHAKLKWQCKKGHIWMSDARKIVDGHTWCPVCSKDFQKNGNAGSVELYKKIAISRGGKLLSETYYGSTVPLLWQCGKGHQWKAAPNSIKNNNSWCKKCYSKTRSDSILIFKTIAKEKNGECLSDVYNGAHRKLKFECDKGHRWHGLPMNIKKGAWCKKCADITKAKYTIGDFKIFANRHGGKCLSQEYNYKTKIKFECKIGHTWARKAGTIINGEWCPVCKQAQRKKKIIVEVSESLTPQSAFALVLIAFNLSKCPDR